jgi:Dehydrogenases with different specificities (related to short-chain alcohol dehydrogenases)
VFLTFRAFIPAMIERRGGSLIAISSMTGKRPLYGRTPYAAAKMGVIGLVRTLATELGPHNRVNAICPGLVAGPRIEAVLARQAAARGITEEAVRAEADALSPLRRMVTAEEVAAACVFLASAVRPPSPARTSTSPPASSCTDFPRRSPMRIIDLSQDIYEGMKVYPGHLKTVQFEHATHEETAPRFEGGFSFQTTGFMLNDNGPTHVDSFSHLDPDPSAETIEQMPLDLFYGPRLPGRHRLSPRAPTSPPPTWTVSRPRRR